MAQFKAEKLSKRLQTMAAKHRKKMWVFESAEVKLRKSFNSLLNFCQKCSKKVKKKTAGKGKNDVENGKLENVQDGSSLYGLRSLVTLESSCNCGSVTVIVTATTRSTAGGKSCPKWIVIHVCYIFIFALSYNETDRVIHIWDSLLCFSPCFLLLLWAFVHWACFLYCFQDFQRIDKRKYKKKITIIKADWLRFGFYIHCQVLFF